MFIEKHLKYRAAMRAAAALPMPINLRVKNAKTMEEVLDEHIATVTRALEKVKAGEKSTDDRLTELRSEITDLSQRMAQGRRGFGGDPVIDTAGARLMREKATDITALASERGRVGMEMRAVTSGSTSAGTLVDPDRQDVVLIPRRPLMVRDLLPVVGTSSGSIEYPKQTARNLNAAAVAEGALKPESDLAWTLATVPVRTIAHWVPASRQILEDAPQLQGLIEEDLLFGLKDVEDMQLLLGDGTGQNLTGLYPAAQPYVAPIVIANPTMIDQLGLAMLQLALADFNADGIVLHPSDWLKIKMTKDADGGYLAVDPITGKAGKDGTDRPMLWGVPVIPTKAISQGKFLVGDFRTAATLYDRWAVRIEVSTEDRDNFVRNMVTILAEERLALAIKQAGALVKGSFS